MSFTKRVATTMEGSWLENLLQHVYGASTVSHMMPLKNIGKHYRTQQ